MRSSSRDKTPKNPKQSERFQHHEPTRCSKGLLGRARWVPRVCDVCGQRVCREYHRVYDQKCHQKCCVGDLFENFGSSEWLPDMDSNHDKQIQRLLCYHYTIGQPEPKPGHY